MDFFFSLQCSSPSAERHFRFPAVVTGVKTLSVEQYPAAPEDDGPERGRLSLSRPSGLRVMSMYLNYEIHSEADLPRSSNDRATFANGTAPFIPPTESTVDFLRGCLRNGPP